MKRESKPRATGWRKGNPELRKGEKKNGIDEDIQSGAQRQDVQQPWRRAVRRAGRHDRPHDAGRHGEQNRHSAALRAGDGVLDLASVHAGAGLRGCGAADVRRSLRRIHRLHGHRIQKRVVSGDGAGIRAAGGSGAGRHLGRGGTALSGHRHASGGADLRYALRAADRLSIRLDSGDKQAPHRDRRGYRRHRGLLSAGDAARILRHSLRIHQRLGADRDRVQPDRGSRGSAESGARFRLHRKRRPVRRSQVYGVVRRLRDHGHAGSTWRYCGCFPNCGAEDNGGFAKAWAKGSPRPPGRQNRPLQNAKIGPYWTVEQLSAESRLFAAEAA